MCKFTVFSRSAFTKHLKVTHGFIHYQQFAKNLEKCQKCNKIPPTLIWHEIHLHWKHDNDDVDLTKNVKCKICKVIFDTYENFKNHLSNHKNRGLLRRQKENTLLMSDQL